MLAAAIAGGRRGQRVGPQLNREPLGSAKE